MGADVVEGSAIGNATLRAALIRSGALAPERAVAVIAQVAAQLDAAAAGKAVRRDVVDPANIVLAADDVAYLAETGTDAMSDSGTSIDGLAYLAPERLTRNAPVSAVTEVYALACVLYECLTGKPPYPATDDLSGLVAAHASAPVPQPSRQLAAIPTGFDKVIARGLDKDPAARYASAGELALAARHALGTPAVQRIEPERPVFDYPAHPESEAPVFEYPAYPAHPSPAAPVVVPQLPSQMPGQPTRRGGRAAALVVSSAAAVVVAMTAAVVALVVTVPRGSVSESTPAQVELAFPGLHDPTSVAVDTAGTVYVVDNHQGVFKLAAGASTPIELPAFNDQSSPLRLPAAVAVDTAGVIYVAGTGVRPGGRPGPQGWVWRLAAGQTEPTELSFTDLHHPTGVAVDTSGNVYVTDTTGGTPPDPRAGAVWMLPAGSAAPTQLSFPGLGWPDSMAVDAGGDVYVTAADGQDSNNRAWKLAAGQGAATELPLFPAVPKAVALGNAGEVYLAGQDSSYARGEVWKLVAGVDPTMLPLTDLRTVSAITVGTDGSVYVADWADKLGGRVLKLSA